MIQSEKILSGKTFRVVEPGPALTVLHGLTGEGEERVRYFATGYGTPPVSVAPIL